MTAPSPNCGTPLFPLACPLPSPPPLDGRHGPCYNIHIPIPTCDISNGTSPTYPLANDFTTWAILDDTRSTVALYTALQGVSFGLSFVTLLNLLVLTPERKRGLLVHWVVLGGASVQILRAVAGVYMGVQGPVGAMYLLVTGDWSGTEWSVGWTGCVMAQQVGAMVVVGCVHVTFWCQCRGLLVWVRIGYGSVAYRVALGVLSGIGAVSWGLRVAFGVYQIYWIGFARRGDWLPDVWDGWWWGVLSLGSAISGGVSFACWSMVFVVSAGWMLWERRTGVLSGIHVGGDAGGKWRVRTVCEKALQLIGFVGVESFLIPLILSILSAQSRTPGTEVLLVPVILALLPLSSLFLQGNESAQSPAQPGGTVQLHIVSPPEAGGRPNRQLGGRQEAAPGGEDATNGLQERPFAPASDLIDRELYEIDSMR